MRSAECRRRAVLLAGAACWPLHGARAQAWLPTPALPDVALQDQDGQAQRLLGGLIGQRAVVVSFFFSGCGTVCPPQTALLRELRQRIDAAGHASDVLFLSISVDPLGDGPAQLRAYAQRFGLHAGASGNWSLLTGAPGDVARVLQGFGVASGAPQQHANLVWMGQATRQRWTRLAGLASPAEMWSRLQELMA
jgi:protein SCO1